MNRIEIDARTDDTGSIRVRLPSPGVYPVHVVVEWEDAPGTPERIESWIRATSGSIQDPTFIRHPQGDYEEREELP